MLIALHPICVLNALSIQQLSMKEQNQFHLVFVNLVCLYFLNQITDKTIGFYTLSTGEFCTGCPEGGVCNGQYERPKANEKYWSSIEEPLLFLKCTSSEACIGGLPGTCGFGYDGELCAKCAEGFFSFSGTCHGNYVIKLKF